MAGILNTNSLLTLAFARDLPGDEKFLAALAAGQMPENNLLGPIAMKRLIDERVVQEEAREAAESAREVLERSLEVEFVEATGQSVPSVRFRIAGATWQTSDEDGVDLVKEEDAVTVTPKAAAASVALIAAVNGVERRIGFKKSMADEASPSAEMRAGPESAPRGRGIAREAAAD